MPQGLGTRAHPFVVRGRYQWRDEPVQEWDSSSHAKLSTAMRHVRNATATWLWLVGGNAQPITWHVIDIRDYSEYRPGIASRFGEMNGTDEAGRDYARREYGPAADQRPVGRVPGRGRRGGATARGARRG